MAHDIRSYHGLNGRSPALLSGCRGVLIFADGGHTAELANAPSPTNKRSESYMSNQFLEKEEAIIRMLKTVYDPEIPVNIYDLGLIYGVDIADDGLVTITMTLTAPNCPAADFIVEDTRDKVMYVDGVTGCHIELTFEPEWNKDMMSEEAMLELGFL